MSVLQRCPLRESWLYHRTTRDLWELRRMSLRKTKKLLHNSAWLRRPIERKAEDNLKEGCRKSTGQRRLHDVEYGQNSRTKQRGLTAWRLYPASGAKSDDDLLMTSATRTLRKIKFQEWFWNIDFNTYFTNTLFRGIKISKTILATLYALFHDI